MASLYNNNNDNVCHSCSRRRWRVVKLRVTSCLMANVGSPRNVYKGMIILVDIIIMPMGKLTRVDVQQVKKEAQKTASKTVMRLSDTKHVQFANTVAGTSIVQASTNPNSNLIPQIIIGTAANQRIGNRIVIKEVFMRGSINWPLGASVGVVRCIIFVDNDCPSTSSTGANWGAIMPAVSAGNEFVANLSSDTYQRFRVLRDFNIRPKNPVNMATTTQGQQEFVKRIRFKKGFLQRYLNGLGNAVTNKSLYYLFVTDLAAGAQPSLRLEGYIKYKDY